MKLGRLGSILGVVISIVIVAFAIMNGEVDSKENKGPVELASNNGTISESGVEFGNVVLDMDNNQNVNKIKFTNTNSYPVNLGTNNIELICTGSGEAKEHDEFIVSRNMRIKAAFAKSEDATKYDSLLVNKNETVFIYVVNEYIGEEYPVNEVNCNYNIDILAQ